MSLGGGSLNLRNIQISSTSPYTGGSGLARIYWKCNRNFSGRVKIQDDQLQDIEIETKWQHLHICAKNTGGTATFVLPTFLNTIKAYLSTKSSDVKSCWTVGELLKHLRHFRYQEIYTVTSTCNVAKQFSQE